MNTTTLTLDSVIHPVSDLAAATTLYATLLGAAPVADNPYYVGFDVGGVQLGLDPSDPAKGMTARWCTGAPATWRARSPRSSRRARRCARSRRTWAAEHASRP